MLCRKINILDRYSEAVRLSDLQLDVIGTGGVVGVGNVRQGLRVGFILHGARGGAAAEGRKRVQRNHPGRDGGGEVLGSEWTQGHVLPRLHYITQM